jgi:hypothetical protein
VIAYKFLREGAVGPFSRVAWPLPNDGEPAEWVRAMGALELCGNGVHACRGSDLQLWLFDELWEIELEAPIHVAPTHVVAAAGRLRARVGGWDPRAAVDFAVACAARTRKLAAKGFAEDAETWARSAAADAKVAAADAACVAYIAAHAAGESGGRAAAAREREWQARWLTERLGLEARLARPEGAS